MKDSTKGLLVGGGTIVSLFIILVIVNKIKSFADDPTGLGEVIDDYKKNQEAIIKNKKKYIDDISISKTAKSKLGASFKTREKNAKMLALQLYRNMQGLSTTAENLVVYAMFKNLNYKNDIRMIVKAFGLKENQNLYDWVKNEDGMNTTHKNYILNKIVQSVQK